MVLLHSPMTSPCVWLVEARIQSAWPATDMSRCFISYPLYHALWTFVSSPFHQGSVFRSAQSFLFFSDHHHHPYCYKCPAILHIAQKTGRRNRLGQSKHFTQIMPAIVHLQPRLIGQSGGNGGVTGTAIALIVCVGIIPCIIIIWAVCFLFWAYPYDRNCCCMKRKRRPEPASVLKQAPLSQETLYEKENMGLPQRPFSAQVRSESGSSSNSGRLHKAPRPGSGMDTRASVQSVGSVNTVQVTHEPKPFV
ncbi:hypothetical protein ACJQWK_02224 [Exserohilum turcicum]